jgi:hypothetical protein
MAEWGGGNQDPFPAIIEQLVGKRLRNHIFRRLARYGMISSNLT